jgi:hypothetical protein
MYTLAEYAQSTSSLIGISLIGLGGSCNGKERPIYSLVLAPLIY